jgi:peptidoglycan hydrolase-like protein with peptidoglycan-binding domain
MLNSYALQNSKKQAAPRASLKHVSIKHVDSVKAVLRPKLKIGQPDDKYEQEADRVAEQVMRMPEPRLSSSVSDSSLTNSTIPHSGTIQRTCTACSKEYEMLQKKSSVKNLPEVLPAINTGITSLQGNGQPLSRSERSFFEPRFGVDFSAVRVHRDDQAAAMAHSINARAFTLGSNVVFGPGEYSADSLETQKLFAHELTHVIQQSGNSDSSTTIQRTIGDGHDLTAPWLARDVFLEAIYDNERLMQNGSRGDAVKKVQQLIFYLQIDFPVYGADGIFGNETKAAVQTFQRAHVDESGTQLVNDGIVGPLTMGALNREANRTGTDVNGLTRTTPLAALPGPSTTNSPALSVDRIDIIDSPTGAIGGFPAILGNASLNTPGPFNDPTEVKNVHQIHFHLDNGSSANLIPLREVRATFMRAGVPNEFPPAQPLPPGVVGPPAPSGAAGSRIQNDGPPAHEIQRPTANTLVVADAPGPRGIIPAQYPVSLQAHFIFTVNDARNAPIARVNYDVFIDKRSAADVPNTDNRIVSVSKRDFVRGRTL